MYQNFINWLEDHRFSCHFREITGMECPGCGMQTAIIEILKGNVLEGVLIFPALVPMLFMVAFMMLHIRFGFRKGPSVLIISFIATLTVMLADYIYKYI